MIKIQQGVNLALGVTHSDQHLVNMQLHLKTL